MRKLIIDLLDMTRIESGEKQRELSEVDMVAVARRVVENNLPEATRRGIVIELHNDKPLPMTADYGELEIILNNLVSNAVKYNRTNGRVDIRMVTEEDRLVLTVTDTGIGMTPEESERLFNDFVRIKNDKTRNILGSGLGLSIVKKLAQLGRRKHEVTIFHVLDPAELEFPFDDPTLFLSMEDGRQVEAHGRDVRKGYLEVMQRWLEETKRTAAEADVDYALCRTDRPLDEVILPFLARRERSAA
jgi:hypothetical protein